MEKTESAREFNKVGSEYYGQGRYEDAISAFYAAINMMPNYSDAYYNLGLALTKASRRSEAVNVYEALLLLEPSHLGANFQLGCIYMQREKEEKALRF